MAPTRPNAPSEASCHRFGQLPFAAFSMEPGTIHCAKAAPPQGDLRRWIPDSAPASEQPSECLGGGISAGAASSLLLMRKTLYRR
jgi:hypothetical protein